MDCRDHIWHLHLENALPDTTEAQWSYRTRLAVANESHQAVLYLIEERETRSEKLKIQTRLISIIGLRNHFPQNNQPLTWECNMIPWFNHDFLLSTSSTWSYMVSPLGAEWTETSSTMT